MMTPSTEEIENAALERIALDDSHGPAPRLDDLARRRWLDEALDKASETERPVSVSRRIVGWAAAAVVALCVGAVALVSFVGGEQADGAAVPSIAPNPAVVTTDAPLSGRVLLVSGEVLVNGKTGETGARLGAGDTIEVVDGRAAVRVDTGVTLMTEARTAVSVVELDSGGIEIGLERGRVLVEVDPEREGPVVGVATGEGRVVVTGTAFAVIREEGVSRVEVFRGDVRLDEGDGSTRLVRFGQAAALGGDRLTDLSDEQILTANRQLKAMGVLEMDAPALLDIQSSPAGAEVIVDDMVLGRTPFTGQIRSGHRTLELAMEGYVSVQELVELAGGGELSRTFLLATSEVSVRRAAEKPAFRERSADELLNRARSFRRSREWKKAADVYGELVRLYSGRAEARSALVSLGLIELEHLGRPGAAVRSFEAYLAQKSRGSLAQEAAFGRAAAYRALGKRVQEIRALEHFLTTFPGAIQAERARARFDAISARSITEE